MWPRRSGGSGSPDPGSWPPHQADDAGPFPDPGGDREAIDQAARPREAAAQAAAGREAVLHGEGEIGIPGPSSSATSSITDASGVSCAVRRISPPRVVWRTRFMASSETAVARPCARTVLKPWRRASRRASWRTSAASISLVTRSATTSGPTTSGPGMAGPRTAGSGKPGDRLIAASSCRPGPGCGPDRSRSSGRPSACARRRGRGRGRPRSSIRASARARRWRSPAAILDLDHDAPLQGRQPGQHPARAAAGIDQALRVSSETTVARRV